MLFFMHKIKEKSTGKAGHASHTGIARLKERSDAVPRSGSMTARLHDCKTA
jgi:hypothetical protein